MHSFPGAAEQSIRTHGFSSSERIWDNKEIMEIAHIFEEKKEKLMKKEKKHVKLNIKINYQTK